MNSRRIRSAIARGIRASPCTSAVRYCSHTPGSTFLMRYPWAPDRMASKRSWGSSETLSTTTNVEGSSSLIMRMASSPLRRGIRKSISTRSGASSRTRAMPSYPSLASPITTNSGDSPRIARMPRRARSLSSTISVRVILAALPVSLGDSEDDRGPTPPRTPRDRDLPADCSRVLADGGQPVAPLPRSRGKIWKALPIVADGHDDLTSLPTDRDPHRARSRMFGHVVERLSQDRHRMELRLQREFGGASFLDYAAGEAVDLPKSVDVGAGPGGKRLARFRTGA